MKRKSWIIGAVVAATILILAIPMIQDAIPSLRTKPHFLTVAMLAEEHLGGPIYNLSAETLARYPTLEAQVLEANQTGRSSYREVGAAEGDTLFRDLKSDLGAPPDAKVILVRYQGQVYQMGFWQLTG